MEQCACSGRLCATKDRCLKACQIRLPGQRTHSGLQSDTQVHNVVCSPFTLTQALCRRVQLMEEVKGVLHLLDEVHEVFSLSYTAALCTWAAVPRVQTLHAVLPLHARLIELCASRRDQMMEEVKGVLRMLDEVYEVFGLSYTAALSTRPDSFLGEPAVWDQAEGALRDALDAVGKKWEVSKLLLACTCKLVRVRLSRLVLLCCIVWPAGLVESGRR